MSDMIVSLFMFGSFVVHICTASYVHTVYQNVPVGHENQRTRYARKSNDLKYCGTRINSSNFSTEPLIAKDWCDVGTRELGYIYMLKTEVIVTRVQSWGFSSLIPVCVENGSTFEIQFTPKTGWDKIRVDLFNEDIRRVFVETIYQTSGTLVDNELASLVIEVQADSFQVYVNGIEYNNVPYTAVVPNYPTQMQIFPVDVKKVIYRATPGYTP